jgi:stage V sporulation protein B
MSHWATDTVLLAVTNFFTGTLGFFYRLILSKYLGSEGMGIYQQTLAFFSTSITVITAGIPVSVSKLVAENRQNNPSKNAHIVTSAFGLTTLFSLFGVIFLVCLSQILNLRLLLIILPASIFVGYSSVMKGYFFGIQNTAPVRWSNVSESVFRILLGTFLINTNILIKFEGKTRGAVSALTIGELISLSLLFVFFTRSIEPFQIYKKNVTLKNIKEILTIAMPISLSQIINSFSISVESLLIPKGLIVWGLSSKEALAVYGKTSGMVLPLLFFPALFIRAFSANIIPQIAKALSLKNTEYAFKFSQQALLLSSFFSFAVTGFFIALSKPLAQLLFPGFELENLIIGFSVGIPFFYIESILIAILRGMGNNITPIINSLLSFFVTNGMLFFLAAKTPMGIYGYAIALITASAIAIHMSMSVLEYTFNRKFNEVDIILKPLICCVFMMYLMSEAYLPLKTLGLPNIICIATDLLLGLSGYLILALSLGIDLKSYKH